MIDSATLSTITMAVAADRPPMKAAMASEVAAVEQRQRQHVEVAAGGAADEHDACQRHGQHEEVDGDQVERKDPGRRAKLFLRTVLDDHHVELAGQHDDGEAGKRRHHQPGAERCAVVERGLYLGVGGERVEQALRARRTGRRRRAGRPRGRRRA